ncbi:MAG TPA: hypothetical protein V6D08_07765 [Candidatus Obscuribacterales bacterium]
MAKLDCGSLADLYGQERGSILMAERTDRTREAQEKLRPARGDRHHLAVENRGASPDYARVVENGLSTLPDRIARELDAAGIKVYVFKDIHDYDRAFGTHKADLREGKDAPSLFDSSAKPPRIAVFEHLADGTPVTGFRNYSPAGLARHEVGHAHDFLNGTLSATDSGFKTTYLDEVRQMPAAKLDQLLQDIGTKSEPGPLLRYFSGPAKDEFYAELFAMATGGASDLVAAQRFRYYFPQTVQYMTREYRR